jgi:hypothetical protein
MPPRRRIVSQLQVPEEPESATPELGPVQHSTPEARQENELVPTVTREDKVEATLEKVADVFQPMSDPRTPQSDDVALERFLKFYPRTFFGGAEQDQLAEQWLEQLEEIYQTLHYTNKQKVKVTAFQLRGPAKNWWQRTRKTTQQEWSWDSFVEIFKEKYIP